MAGIFTFVSYNGVRYLSLPIKKFKYRNPNEGDLENLSEQQMEIEELTFPLPVSAVCEDEVFLLISIFSEPKNIERRNLIRKTWGNTYIKDVGKVRNLKPFHFGRTYILTGVVKTVFVVGQSKNKYEMMSVFEEASYYKDIVLGGFQENYRNMTLKLKLALKSAYYNCKASFYMKMDDDSFANPVVIVEWLKERTLYNLYTGYTQIASPVVRDKRHKW